MTTTPILMLLAEDNPSEADLILASLSKDGYAEAVHVVHEVLRELKADSRTRSIPVVMLTSSNIERDVARGYHVGANSYVQKPVDLERFRRTVCIWGCTG